MDAWSLLPVVHWHLTVRQADREWKYRTSCAGIWKIELPVLAFILIQYTIYHFSYEYAYMR